MGDFATLQHSRIAEDDTALATYFKALSNPGAANTKGAWTELVASTPFDVEFLILTCSLATNAFQYVDIGIGAAGSEVVVVPNLSLTRQGITVHSTHNVALPLAIPKGTRIAMRYQRHTGGSEFCNAKLAMIASAFASIKSPQVWEDWGTDTTDTQSKAVVTSASANTMGSWVELVAATGLETRWAIVANQAIESARNIAFDIGIGAAGSEVVIIPKLQFTNEENGDIYGPIPLRIPKGSRIAARAASTTGSSTTLIAMYGGGRG